MGLLEFPTERVCLLFLTILNFYFSEFFSFFSFGTPLGTRALTAAAFAMQLGSYDDNNIICHILLLSLGKIGIRRCVRVDYTWVIFLYNIILI